MELLFNFKLKILKYKVIVEMNIVSYNRSERGDTHEQLYNWSIHSIT